MHVWCATALLNASPSDPAIVNGNGSSLLWRWWRSPTTSVLCWPTCAVVLEGCSARAGSATLVSGENEKPDRSRRD